MTTATSLLLDTARRGELHHAILLHGPMPALLRDVAMRIAKTINCLNGSTGDDCMSCQRIDRRIHPDVHFIEVGGERKLISVEQIREIVSGAVMRPFEGRGKVFIIDPADALSASGSNSLLKTLEEPARDTTFVLLTRSSEASLILKGAISARGYAELEEWLGAQGGVTLVFRNVDARAYRVEP